MLFQAHFRGGADLSFGGFKTHFWLAHFTAVSWLMLTYSLVHFWFNPDRAPTYAEFWREHASIRTRFVNEIFQIFKFFNFSIF